MPVEKKHRLPTLQELYGDKKERLAEYKLLTILNSPPKAEWIKKHPMTGIDYLPIERVEYLLTMIYGSYCVDILSTQLLANSVVVTVRLKVKNPITSAIEYQDGIGAVPIQVDKGSGAINFDKMKSNAIQLGAPAAKSYAIKDAAEQFGKIFGRDVSRKTHVDYMDSLNNRTSSLDDTQSTFALIDSTKTIEELRTVIKNVTDKKVLLYAREKMLSYSPQIPATV